eukprot:gene13704-33958_t
MGGSGNLLGCYSGYHYTETTKECTTTAAAINSHPQYNAPLYGRAVSCGCCEGCGQQNCGRTLMFASAADCECGSKALGAILSNTGMPSCFTSTTTTKTVPATATTITTITTITTTTTTYWGDLGITSPTAASTFKAGDKMKIIWTAFKSTMTYKLRFNLYLKDPSYLLFRTTEAVFDVEQGQYTFDIPPWVQTNEYWIALSKDDTYTIAGHAPMDSALVLSGSGSHVVMGGQGFTITRPGCQSHGRDDANDACKSGHGTRQGATSMARCTALAGCVYTASTDSCTAGTTICSSEEYCDTEQSCYSCNACSVELDAFDGICPAKCGGSTAIRIGMRLPDVPEPEAVGLIKDVILPNSRLYERLTNASSLANVAFKANVDGITTMTSKLQNKLEALGLLVKEYNAFNRFNATVLVKKAYIKASSSVNENTVTYHHEGRALEMALQCPSDFASECSKINVIGELVRAAHTAGFDWVTLLDDSTVYGSVSQIGCSAPLDLVFLIDSSGSLDGMQWGGFPGTFSNKVLKFLKSVTQEFDIGLAKNQTRVGVVSFASTPRIEFKLNQHTTSSAVLDAIDKIEYTRGSTYTRDALETVRTQVFQTSAGMRPTDESIPKVLVVLTDGQSNYGQSPILNANNGSFADSEADKLHRADITILSIGVGKGITGQAKRELDGLASDPDYKHSVYLKSFANIFSIVEQISHSACESAVALACGSSTTMTLPEGMFSYFTVSNADTTSRVSVNVQMLEGTVHAFASSVVPTPGPFNNEGAQTTSNPTKKVEVSGDMLYVSVKGAAKGSSRARVTMVCLPPKDDGPDMCNGFNVVAGDDSLTGTEYAEEHLVAPSIAPSLSSPILTVDCPSCFGNATTTSATTTTRTMPNIAPHTPAQLLVYIGTRSGIIVLDGGFDEDGWGDTGFHVDGRMGGTIVSSLELQTSCDGTAAVNGDMHTAPTLGVVGCTDGVHAFRISYPEEDGKPKLTQLWNNTGPNLTVTSKVVLSPDGKTVYAATRPTKASNGGFTTSLVAFTTALGDIEWTRTAVEQGTQASADACGGPVYVPGTSSSSDAICFVGFQSEDDPSSVAKGALLRCVAADDGRALWEAEETDASELSSSCASPTLSNDGNVLYYCNGIGCAAYHAAAATSNDKRKIWPHKNSKRIIAPPFNSANKYTVTTTAVHGVGENAILFFSASDWYLYAYSGETGQYLGRSMRAADDLWATPVVNRRENIVYYGGYTGVIVASRFVDVSCSHSGKRYSCSSTEYPDDEVINSDTSTVIGSNFAKCVEPSGVFAKYNADVKSATAAPQCQSGIADHPFLWQVLTLSGKGTLRSTPAVSDDGHLVYFSVGNKDPEKPVADLPAGGINLHGGLSSISNPANENSLLATAHFVYNDARTRACAEANHNWQSESGATAKAWFGKDTVLSLPGSVQGTRLAQLPVAKVQFVVLSKMHYYDSPEKGVDVKILIVGANQYGGQPTVERAVQVIVKRPENINSGVKSSSKTMTLSHQNKFKTTAILVLPAEWFADLDGGTATLEADFTLTLLLDGVSPSSAAAGTLLLQPRRKLAADQLDDQRLEVQVPYRPLFPGESFAVEVYARTNKPLQTYNMVFEVEGDGKAVQFSEQGIVSNPSGSWKSTPQYPSEKTVALAYIGASREAGVDRQEGGRELLFTANLKVPMDAGEGFYDVAISLQDDKDADGKRAVSSFRDAKSNVGVAAAVEARP